MGISTIHTVDCIFKTWRDRVNGNTYFGGFVIVNHCMEDEQTITMPFQYGGEGMAEQTCWAELWKLLGIADQYHHARWLSNGKRLLPNGNEVIFRLIDRGRVAERELERWLKHSHRAFNG